MFLFHLAVWKDHWVYWAGPFSGSTLAAIIYFAIFDRVDRPKIKDIVLEVNDIGIRLSGNQMTTV